MAHLWPCEDCARLIRDYEQVCPFCGGTVRADVARRRVEADPIIERPTRLARSAIAALAAAIATGGLVACTGQTAPVPTPVPISATAPTTIPVAEPPKPAVAAPSTIELIASAPQPAPPLPAIPPVARRREHQRDVVEQVRRDHDEDRIERRDEDRIDQQDREVLIRRMMQPYGAPPPFVDDDGTLC